ncbi:ABC transporter ATP-binding protein [Tomitella biformata]|uniref:ABC transporter ATP-binding protein n=1 Tax=Tomitella biformata TaxID=630403 RepID=UPI00046788D3|nr:ATP-binding cassette domain-containing protein [Tomitella biformata]
MIGDQRPAVLELSSVSFVREGRTVLDAVSLTVRAGERWAMLGSNGAGKTTVLGLCGAQSHPTTGTVRVLGEQLGRVDLQVLRRSIGHVNPRHPLRSPLTIREVVLTGLRGSVDLPPRWQPNPQEVARADELIADLGLEGKAELRWPTLSQGERGRALIARALIADPRLLLLDEPSTGLDVAAREILMETLDGLDTSHPDLASILVTHHLEELPSSTTHALLIAHGRVAASGAADEVITSREISDAFEHPIDVSRVAGRWSARARPRVHAGA